MVFFLEIGFIVVYDNSVIVCLYCWEIFLFKIGSVKKIIGCYEDELIKVNGVWFYFRWCYFVLINEVGLFWWYKFFYCIGLYIENLYGFLMLEIIDVVVIIIV